ncbi:hypothetical protein AB0B21_33195 [Streptomyces rimosus]|uniref:hypothetical protein n=1 Tax=Streptomyces rimosus TaxID=1927 RepID=UPI00067B2416|nr:hypothetical protein [Streptomyces rimosus]
MAAFPSSSRALLGLGRLLVATGVTVLAFAPLHSDWTNYAIGGLTSGLGTGLINGEMSNVAIGIMPASRSGMASGINSTMRIVGMTAGFGGIGAVLTAAVSHDLTSQADKLHGPAPQRGRAGHRSRHRRYQRCSSLRARRSARCLPRRSRSRLLHRHAHRLHRRACVAFLGAIASFALIRRPQAEATVKSADRRPLADAQAF